MKCYLEVVVCCNIVGNDTQQLVTDVRYIIVIKEKLMMWVGIKVCRIFKTYLQPKIFLINYLGEMNKVGTKIQGIVQCIKQRPMLEGHLFSKRGMTAILNKSTWCRRIKFYASNHQLMRRMKVMDLAVNSVRNDTRETWNELFFFQVQYFHVLDTMSSRWSDVPHRTHR